MSLSYDNLIILNEQIQDNIKKNYFETESNDEKEVTSEIDFLNIILDVNIITYHISFFIYAYVNKKDVLNLIEDLINKSYEFNLCFKLNFLFDDINNNNNLFIRRNEAYKYYNKINYIDDSNLKLYKIIKNNNYILLLGIIIKNNILSLSIKLKDNITDIIKIYLNKKYNIPNLNKKSPDDIINIISELIFGTNDFSYNILYNKSYIKNNKEFSYDNNIIFINKNTINVNKLNITYVCRFFNLIPIKIYEEYLKYNKLNTSS